MKNNFFKKRGIEPLISAILLIVVSVILVTVILSFGKDFTRKGLNKTENFLEITGPSDKQNFIRFVEAQNGMYVFDYHPPNQADINFTVVQYSYLGYPYIPLEPEYNFNKSGKHYIPLGIIDEDRFGISLVLDDGTYLTFNNVTNRNLSPSPNDCPTGYIPVPGNYLYGTVGPTGGFCVMKYDGKVDNNGDGIGDTNLICDAYNINLWVNQAPGCNVDNINRKLVSTPEGYVLWGQTLQQAKDSCNYYGANYHLITNDEWMTLVRNIERISENWTGGSIGNGKIYKGHYAMEPLFFLEATNDDTNGYYQIPESGFNIDKKRTLKLSNGEIIWDFSGNGATAVDFNVLNRIDLPWALNTTNNSIIVGFTWTQYVGMDLNIELMNYGIFKYKDIMLLNKDFMQSNYDSGRLATLSGYTLNSSDTYMLRRGAVDSCGIVELGVNQPTTSTMSAARCVYTPQ